MFSIAIIRTHILVGMQYTLNNLYTNDIHLIFYLRNWFTKKHKNSVEPAWLKQVTGVKPIAHAPLLQYFGLWPSLESSFPSPEQLAETARWSTSSVMAVRQGEIGTNDFCAQQIRSKKIQLTFCGLRNVAAVRRLNDSHHKRKENRLQPALCWHAILNASGFCQLGLLQREMPHSIHFNLTAHTCFQSISPLYYPWWHQELYMYIIHVTVC